VIDQLVARAATVPFAATMCASAAATIVAEAPAAAFGVLDRLVGLPTAHPIVVENALWAARQLGYATVDRARLERYWTLAIAGLAAHPELLPYLVELAPVLGRDPPSPPTPPRGRQRR
jgi:hypothetical protein